MHGALTHLQLCWFGLCHSPTSWSAETQHEPRINRDSQNSASDRRAEQRVTCYYKKLTAPLLENNGSPPQWIINRRSRILLVRDYVTYEKFTDRGTNANYNTRNYSFILLKPPAGRVLGGEPGPGAVIERVLGRQAGSQHRPHLPAHRHLAPVSAHTTRVGAVVIDRRCYWIL